MSVGDTFLVPGEYFYHLSTVPATEYSLVMDFVALTFPDRISPQWSRYRSEEEIQYLERRCEGLSVSDLSEWVKAEDQCCIVTKHLDRVVSLHYGVDLLR